MLIFFVSFFQVRERERMVFNSGVTIFQILRMVQASIFEARFSSYLAFCFVSVFCLFGELGAFKIQMT